MHLIKLNSDKALSAKAKKEKKASERYSQIINRTVELIENEKSFIDLDKEIIGYNIIERICELHLYENRLVTSGLPARNHLDKIESMNAAKEN